MISVIMKQDDLIFRNNKIIYLYNEIPEDMLYDEIIE